MSLKSANFGKKEYKSRVQHASIAMKNVDIPYDHILILKIPVVWQTLDFYCDERHFSVMTGHTLDALSHIKFPGIYNNSKTQQDLKQIIMPMSLLINNNYVDNVFLFLYLHVLLYEHNTCSERIQSLHVTFNIYNLPSQPK